MQKHAALLLLPTLCIAQLLPAVPAFSQAPVGNPPAHTRFYAVGSHNVCHESLEDLATDTYPIGTRLSVAASTIALSHLKIFDDSTLQQQLFLNYSRISSLSGFDQTSLTSHLGNISGIDQSYVNTGLNVGGPGSTSQVSTAYTPNATTSLTGTTGLPNSQATTTSSAAIPASNVAAAPTAASSGPAVQSQAVFSEQTQLAARLSTELLETEGALSDRLVTYRNLQGNDITATRPRMTFGFEVTLQPTQHEQDQAAVVEEIISLCPNSYNTDTPPAVTALLPAETTFNVASVTNRSTNLGAGFATAVLGVSGGIGFGRNTYYLAQDQDTLAQVFDPVDPNDPSLPDPVCYGRPCIGVRWIFKPVLGKRFVQPNRRVLAAQFAFPASVTPATYYASADVRTYWRSFDRKNGIVGKIIPHKFSELYSVPLKPLAISDVRGQNELSFKNLEDLGNGQIKVSIHNSYLPNTIVRVGSTLIGPANGLVLGTNQFSFVASATDILTKKTVVVFPSQEERAVQLLEPQPIWLAQTSDKFSAISVTTLDNSKSLLRVSFCSYFGDSPYADQAKDRIDRPLLLIASHAYGLSDSPFAVTVSDPANGQCPQAAIDGAPANPTTHEKLDAFHLKLSTISLAISTATLTTSPYLLLKRPLGNESETLPVSLLDTPQKGTYSLLSQPGKIVLFSQLEDGADFLLYGNRLAGAKLVQPDAPLSELPGAPATFASEVRRFSLSNKQIGQYKFVVLSRKDEAPELLTLPAVKISSDSDGPEVLSAVLIGQDTAILNGIKFADVKRIEFGKKPIHFEPKGESAIRLTGLRAAGVTSQASLQNLDVFLKKETPNQVPIDVYTQKTQIVTRADPKAK
jgi:hypothetical protein